MAGADHNGFYFTLKSVKQTYPEMKQKFLKKFSAKRLFKFTAVIIKANVF